MEAIIGMVEPPEGRRRSVVEERALRELDAVRRFVARGPYRDRETCEDRGPYRDRGPRGEPGPYGGAPR